MLCSVIVQDTSPEAQRRYYELLGQLSPEQRLARAARLSHATRELALAGIRQQQPQLDETEVKIALAERLYGRGTADRIARRLRADSRRGP